MEVFVAARFCRLILFLVILHLATSDKSQKSTDDVKDKWKKKDIRDYSEADMERLYDQWEESEDEPLEDDELPEWKRPQPKIDLSKLNANDPEGMLKMSKQGRTLMMFATVSGNPSEKETETITQIWQSSLFNAHYDVQRYVVGSNRVLFLLKDGSTAWPVKDFLVTQERCEVVTIEGKDYPGKGSKESESKDDSSGKKSPKSTKSKKDGKADEKIKAQSQTNNANKKDKKNTDRKGKTKEDL